MIDFEKNILELKEPIFTVRIGKGTNYKEIKLFLNGDCFVENYGNKENRIRIFIYNNYYVFIRSSISPHRGEAVPKDGSLLNFLASYVSNNKEKWS